MPVVCVYHQVAVKVIEVQQLAGLDIDPVIRIQVGDKRKYSSIKQSTNSPYYDEVSGSTCSISSDVINIMQNYMVVLDVI